MPDRGAGRAAGGLAEAGGAGPDAARVAYLRNRLIVALVFDRICGVFVPAVLAASCLTLAGWLLAGSPAEEAFSAALAVLIIACSCALGLATPAALMVACGRGARLGIFITRYEALESSRAVDVMVLDKTGTVTARPPRRQSPPRQASMR